MQYEFEPIIKEFDCFENDDTSSFAFKEDLNNEEKLTHKEEINPNEYIQNVYEKDNPQFISNEINDKIFLINKKNEA